MSTGNLLKSRLKLRHLIHPFIQSRRIDGSCHDQLGLRLSCLADQGAQLLQGENPFIQDPQDLIQDQDIAFSGYKNLF